MYSSLIALIHVTNKHFILSSIKECLAVLTMLYKKKWCTFMCWIQQSKWALYRVDPRPVRNRFLDGQTTPVTVYSKVIDVPGYQIALNVTICRN